MLLFLDFDGVTHPVSGSPFDMACLRNLEIALDGYSVDIVITSSWREHYTIEQLKKPLGKQLAKRVVGMTPVIEEPHQKYVRYHEVLQYISEMKANPHTWVAVDDTAGFYPAEAPVVWCNPRIGMTEREAEQLRLALLILQYHESFS